MKITNNYQEKKQEITIKELSEEDKNIKIEYGRTDINMSEEKKERLKKYQKIIVKLIKANSLNLIKKCMPKSITNCSFCLFLLIFLMYFLPDFYNVF